MDFVGVGLTLRSDCHLPYRYDDASRFFITPCSPTSFFGSVETLQRRRAGFAADLKARLESVRTVRWRQQMARQGRAEVILMEEGGIVGPGRVHDYELPSG